MSMYDRAAKRRLREKVEYELWILGFISNTKETFGRGKEMATVSLRNRQRAGPGVFSFVGSISLGGRARAEVVTAISPLTFCTSYKVLDMIFEWILEENYAGGNIRDRMLPSKWTFKKKRNTIKNPQLDHPPLMRSEPYIKDYLFALYDNLLKYRHEIVHRNKFSVSKGKLTVTTCTNTGGSYTLELNQEELEVFVRIVVYVANFLTEDLRFGTHWNPLLKYQFDRIQKLHGLVEFKQAKPLFVTVILEVPIENGIFPADLRHVRLEMNRKYPGRDVQFHLKIKGLVDDKPQMCWFLPVDAVPKNDLLELPSDSFEKYRVLPSEGD